MSMPTAGAPHHPAQVPAALDTLQAVMSELENEIDKLREHISPALRPAEPTPGPPAPVGSPPRDPADGSDLANRVNEVARHANALVHRLYGTRARIDL